MSQKVKSARQVRYLLSSGSPLTTSQRQGLLSELHSGAVKVKKGAKKRTLLGSS